MTKLVDQPLPGMPEPEAMEVHPVADLFPMLADDELAELAADIKARGQLQPIVLDAGGRVLDGRNRLAACRIAGVEPRFDYYTGDDPVGYALAVNVARRQMSQGQIAMVVELGATMAPELTDVEFSKRHRDRASVVRQYGEHDLAPAVVAGDLSLPEAYERAQERKRVAERRRTDMVRLKRDAPDLYELVESGKLAPDDGIAALNDREAKARAEEEAARSAAEQAQRQREQDERNAVDRGRQGIEQVLVGWPYFRDYVLNDPESDRAKAVLASLNESQQHSVRTILEQIGA